MADQPGSSNESSLKTQDSTLQYICYGTERESPYLPAIKALISNDLSEPYSIYVYRYFLYQWGDLCFMAVDGQNDLIGVIVCKVEPHRGGPMRGYIAMLATRQTHRGQGIATKLVRMAIEAMIAKDADEIVLETEVDNVPSLKIYERLGFIRSKRLHRYYLNGNTAFRLILYLKPGIPYRPTYPPDYPPIDPLEASYYAPAFQDDALARQAAQMQIEDVYGQSHNPTQGGL